MDNNESQGYAFQSATNIDPVPHTEVNNADGTSYQAQNSDYSYQNNGETNNQEEKKSSGYAIASLVLGILSLITTCCCFCIPLINLVFGILAIVFAIVDKNRPDKTGMSTGGLVCGIIGVVLSIFLMFFPKIAVRVATDQLRKAGYSMEEILKEFNLEEFTSGEINFEDFDILKFLKGLEESFSEE